MACLLLAIETPVDGGSAYPDDRCELRAESGDNNDSVIVSGTALALRRLSGTANP